MFRKFCLVALLGSVALNSAWADRIDQMISPAFHPVTFEDPRAISEARFLYAYHKIDDKFATEGGDVNVYALQLRYAVSDDFAIIATKDGYVDFNPEATLPKEEGWADIEAGFKYVVLRNAESGQVASLQLRYLLPTGDEDVFQGLGDGELHPSASVAYALGDQATFTFGTGLRIAMDSDQSSFWDVDAQLDYRIDTGGMAVYPLVGASLIYVVDDGEGLAIPDEGQDFFNLGASDAQGESMVLGTAGLRARITDDLDLGSSFQFPFDPSAGTRIIEYRWMFDAIFRF